MGRPKLGWEQIFFAVICTSLAIYGVLKYSEADKNSMEKFVQKANDHETRIKAIEKLKPDIEAELDRIDSFQAKMNEWETRVNTVEGELEQTQEHLGRMRRSQQDLKDRSYPQHLELNVKHTGAIPVEIYSSPPQYPRPGKKKRSAVVDGSRG